MRDRERRSVHAKHFLASPFRIRLETGPNFRKSIPFRKTVGKSVYRSGLHVRERYTPD